MQSVSIVVNGEPRAAAIGTTVAALLAQLRIEGRFAVERNGDILPRSQYAATALADGDRLEIVHAIGGG
jgi:thiamine biosynthesis protein ThiS